MGLNEALALQQVSPRQWGAVVDYDNRPRHGGTKEQVVLHWPGVEAHYVGGLDESARALQGFEDYHRSGVYWGIAYDWAVDQKGILYRLRGAARSGAQSGDYDSDGIDNNAEQEGLLLIYGIGQSPTLAMVQTVVRFLRAYGRPPISHATASGPRQCPGQPAVNKIITPYNNGQFGSAGRFYTMLIYADSWDALTVMGQFAHRPRAAATTSLAEAKEAANRGEHVVALGGPAAEALFPDLAKVGHHKSGNREVLFGRDSEHSEDLLKQIL